MSISIAVCIRTKTYHKMQGWWFWSMTVIRPREQQHDGKFQSKPSPIMLFPFGSGMIYLKRIDGYACV